MGDGHASAMGPRHGSAPGDAGFVARSLLVAGLVQTAKLGIDATWSGGRKAPAIEFPRMSGGAFPSRSTSVEALARASMGDRRPSRPRHHHQLHRPSGPLGRGPRHQQGAGPHRHRLLVDRLLVSAGLRVDAGGHRRARRPARRAARIRDRDRGLVAGEHGPRSGTRRLEFFRPAVRPWLLRGRQLPGGAQGHARGFPPPSAPVQSAG